MPTRQVADVEVIVTAWRARCANVVVLILLSGAAAGVHAWGPQGHRLVALVAAQHLTPVARQNVAWLLGAETLADIAVWADNIRNDNYQTANWHFLNIPVDATRYDRDRDCPRQPGVAAGVPADKWRDCAVDRILYNQERLANTSLDRADRAIALKFLVHLVGDLHQPFHALGVERGGNGIAVSAFGSANCGDPGGPSFPCNLHGVWDSALIAHRHVDDAHYLATLEAQIREHRWETRPQALPADWAMESHALGKAALVSPRANVDEPYFRAKIPVIEERLSLAGLRLAMLLNRIFTTPPPPQS